MQYLSEPGWAWDESRPVDSGTAVLELAAKELHGDAAYITMVEEEVAALHGALAEASKKVLGQEPIIRDLLLAMMCEGHVLLEGLPGLGKTLLVQTIGQVGGLDVSRIQFTPDLMPADITGTMLLVTNGDDKGTTKFRPGPIFAQLVLADEINRATPKTQSALLEAMQERSVTVGHASYPLPRPFHVFATQNPIEMEGTYPLPEAQIDRFFFKLNIQYPPEDVLMDIVDQTTGTDSVEVPTLLSSEHFHRVAAAVRGVLIATHVKEAAVRLVMACQPDRPSAAPGVARYVRFGVSPRGLQTLVLAAKANALLEGRYNVAVEDLKAVAKPALRHRLHLNFHAQGDGVQVDDIVDEAVDRALGRVFGG